MAITPKEFLARQLNDHTETARGVRQPTHFTWNENHLEQALDLGFQFLYTLIPEEFATIKELEVTEADCIFWFCDACNKFLGIIDLKLDDDNKCFALLPGNDEQMAFDDFEGYDGSEDNGENDLMQFFGESCYNADDEDEEEIDEYYYQPVDSTTCAVRFSRELPVGAVIRYSCAEPPDWESMNDDALAEYFPIVTEYAMAWLYRTDSESVSNLERFAAHFSMLKWLVETKLLIEFSIVEDDFARGRQKIPD